MVIGQTLFKLDGNAYYSPPFPRGGLAATFAADVTQVSGGPTFTITVEHRAEDSTTWSTAGTFSSITAVGATSVDIEDLQEVIRFKYTFDAGDQQTDAVHFLMQAPSWRPY